MLVVSEISAIPEGLAFMQFSRAEWEKATEDERNALVKVSPQVWRVERDGQTVLIAGTLCPGLGDPPELWLLICDAIKISLRQNVLALRMLIQTDLLSVYPHVIVHVDAKHNTGRRFAEFMGFSPALESTVTHDREYLIYEIRNGN